MERLHLILFQVGVNQSSFSTAPMIGVCQRRRSSPIGRHAIDKVEIYFWEESRVALLSTCTSYSDGSGVYIYGIQFGVELSFSLHVPIAAYALSKTSLKALTNGHRACHAVSRELVVVIMLDVSVRGRFAMGLNNFIDRVILIAFLGNPSPDKG